MRFHDRDLHHPDGTHRATPPATDGHTLDVFERAMRRHRADGHTHDPPCTCNAGDLPAFDHHQDCPRRGA